MPNPIDGSPHYGDFTLVPMQMLTAPYAEASLTPETRQRFHHLYRPHHYAPRSFFPPHDKEPRRYSFWLEDGLSVGGVEWDEDQLGGPKGIQDQFVPGVIQWDSGSHGAGCGWLSVGRQVFVSDIRSGPRIRAVRSSRRSVPSRSACHHRAILPPHPPPASLSSSGQSHSFSSPKSHLPPGRNHCRAWTYRSRVTSSRRGLARSTSPIGPRHTGSTITT